MSITKHRLLFNISDLLAVRIDCAKCGTGVSVPLAAARTLRVPRECPSCHEEWRPRSEATTNTVHPVDGLLTALQTIRGADGTLCIARFEVAETKPPMAS